MKNPSQISRRTKTVVAVAVILAELYKCLPRFLFANHCIYCTVSFASEVTIYVKPKTSYTTRISRTVLSLLELEDRYTCVNFALYGLNKSLFTIPELYIDIISPSLSESKLCAPDDADCIWVEHVKSGIVRTVVESCHIHVMSCAKKAIKKHATVLVFCPEKELHELGARMVTDFFTLCGWKAFFAGAHTPREQVRAAVLREHPSVIAISVSDFYNIVEADKAIARIRSLLQENSWDGTRIYVGGTAFKNNPGLVNQISADGALASYDDILKLEPINFSGSALKAAGHTKGHGYT